MGVARNSPRAAEKNKQKHEIVFSEDDEFRLSVIFLQIKPHNPIESYTYAGFAKIVPHFM